MKANELMIGDWVYEGNDHPIQVVRNYGRSIMYKEEYSNEVEETCLNPIPLTEEILKANGFKDHGNRYDLKVSVLGKEDSHDTFSIAKDWVNPDVLYFRVSMMFPRLHYVHQLQHALRLCGLNDLADNFKLK